jgi:propanol-preferring alcohol dehydrogenase
MRAAVLRDAKRIAEKPLAVGEAERPQVLSRQVLLRVKACGVCRTDLHIVEGELAARKRPVIPGHQIVGEIVDGASP